MMQKTFSMKTEAAVADRKWQVVDVAGLTLGRACTQIAHVLRGKHKPTYHAARRLAATSSSCINAAKIHLTGKQDAGQALLPSPLSRAVSPPSPPSSCSSATPRS